MIVQHPKFSLLWSWTLWLIWTSLLLYLQLSPSKGTGVSNISLFFGGTEITDAMGHVILFFVESALSFNLLRRYKPDKLAKPLSFWTLLILGFSLESLQVFVPSRGVSLLDYVANLSGVFLFFLVLSILEKR
jgi:VanZ family protein